MIKRRTEKRPKASPKTMDAPGPDYQFVRKMLTFGYSYVPHVGDVIETYDDNYKPALTGTVVSVKGKIVVVRAARGKESEIDTAKYVHVESSPTIDAVWNDRMRSDRPDGVAYADNLVTPALRKASRTRRDARPGEHCRD